MVHCKLCGGNAYRMAFVKGLAAQRSFFWLCDGNWISLGWLPALHIASKFSMDSFELVLLKVVNHMAGGVPSLSTLRSEIAQTFVFLCYFLCFECCPSEGIPLVAVGWIRCYLGERDWEEHTPKLILTPNATLNIHKGFHEKECLYLSNFSEQTGNAVPSSEGAMQAASLGVAGEGIQSSLSSSIRTSSPTPN